MTRQREEASCVADASVEPHCIVPGCTAPVAAEVHDGDYGAALELFRGIRQEQVRGRRQGKVRIRACREHVEAYPGLSWQLLMFSGEE
jgi:hypothetical protein